MMRARHGVLLAGALFAAAACGTDATVVEFPARLEVNIQVTGTDNIQPMMNELHKRGIVATVWLNGAEIDAACGSVGTWAQQGYEIAGKYPTNIDDETTRREQEAEMDAIAQAGSRCGAGTVTGFRANRFTANQDTYELMDEKGFDYLERSARAERFSVYRFKPYALQGHSFAVLPMPIVVYYGETLSMCDNACQDMMTPDELLEYEKKAIDIHLKTGEPLIFEWHPGTTYPGDETGWWGAFTGLVDELQNRGSAVRFVTARQLVEQYATAK